MAKFTELEVYTMFLIGTLGVLLPTIAAILFFVFYQRRLLKQHKENKALEASYQRELLEANIQTQEKVRKQIAKDLHDDVGSNLSAIKLYINQIQLKIKKEEFPVEQTQHAKDLAINAIQSVRQISHNLLPPLLESFGLVEALQDFVDKLNGADAFQINFEHNWQDQPRLDIQKELALFRIVQELINNTLKHAQAQHIRVHLFVGQQKLKLLYEDDGIGFEMTEHRTSEHQLIKPLKEQPSKKGLGLKNIESRVQVLNGHMSFHSEKGKGLQVEIHLNLV
ncbi:hypothetical protein BKI52_18570 [marine bacterium AO1-C]|nr:hypothetical protein BKI52_18570 [marine bacterium AO1-C]